MKLNQDKIQRMFNGQGSVAGGGGSSFDPSVLFGLATEQWTEENYVSKTFFNELFVIHKLTTTVVYDENDQEISRTTSKLGTFLPNELPSETETVDEETGYKTVVTTAVDNIEAKKGVWTNFFMSALGLNDAGGGGGVGDVTWDALEDDTDYRQIALSHLTTALQNYATQTWVQTQGYVTQSAISDMATKTWVGQQGFLTSSAISDMATKTWVGQQGYLTSSAISDMATKTWVGQQGFITSVTGTFWGRTFTNGGTVTGTLESVQHIQMTGHLYMHYGATGIYLNSDGTGIDWHDANNNYVSSLLAFTSGQVQFNQDAYIPASKILRLGDAVFEWDSTNNAVKVRKATGANDAVNFYATGGVSALGYGPSGGGGTGDVTWDLLADNTDTRQIALSHLTTALSGYATQNWVQGAYLPLTGGTLSGAITVNETSTSIFKNNSSRYALAINRGTDQNTAVISFDGTASNEASHLGHNATSFYIFNYNSYRNNQLGTNGVTYLALFNAGHFVIGNGGSVLGNSSDSYFYISNSGNVGIGTVSPSYKLDVNGNIQGSSFIKNGGTSSQFLKADGSVDSNSYVTSSGVTSVATGTGLTGGPITTTGTISIDSTYQTYISHGENAYNSLSNYLPLTGGTLTLTALNSFNIKRNSNFAASIHFENETDGNLGYIYIGGSGSGYSKQLIYQDYNNSPYKIWNAGNDGTDSGLDADLLDGQHGSYYATAASLGNYLPLTGGTLTNANGVLTIQSTTRNSYQYFCITENYRAVISVSVGYYNGIAFIANERYVYSPRIGVTDGGVPQFWTKYDGTGNNYTLIHAGNISSQSVASAATLTTARRLWGNSFNGSADLSGSIHMFATGSGWNEGVRMHIAANGWCGLVMCGSDNTGASGTSAKTWGIHNNDGTFWINRNNSNGHTGVEICCGTANNWGVGTVSPQYKLHVGGTFGCDSSATFGGNVVSGTSGGAIDGFHSWELNTHNTLGSGLGGFLDFHYEGTSYDYSTRIIEDEANVLSFIGKSTTNGTNTRACLRVGANYGGTSYNGSYVQIGAIRIVYNSGTNALRVVKADGNAANFYATGSVSALGISSSVDGTVSASLIPSTTGTYELGSSSYGWKKIYLSSNSSNSYTGTISVDADGINLISSNGGYLSGTRFLVNGRLVVNESDDLYPSYALYVNGNTYCDGSISASNVINRSDMRLKDVLDDLKLDLQTIANAPLFKFIFRKGERRVMVGTSAQYWQVLLPEAVFADADGMLGLDYGVTALASAISLAREVSEHDRRIAALEAENMVLRAEIKDLKAA